MAGHAELMRTRYEQFSEGDVKAATSEWVDDFVWRGAADERMPGGGEVKGREAALAKLAEAVGAWDEYSITPETFLEDGDTVVVLGHQDVRKGGDSVTGRFVHIWTWRGEEGTGLEVLTDTLLGARLLGLA